MHTKTTSAAPTDGDRSVIGPTVQLHGELTGTEMLVIQGTVTGTIAHGNHVVVEQDGQINGSVQSRRLTIEGTVDGNVSAIERVVVRNTANLHGHITGARITVDHGTDIGDVVLDGRIGLSAGE